MPSVFRTLQRRQSIITLSATTAAVACAYIFQKDNLFSPAPSSAHNMSTSASASAGASFPTRSYTSRQTAFPYSAADLTPSDPSSDASFYSSPRFVTHIDDHAISLLQRYYGSVLPSPAPASPPGSATRRPRVLDLCSSWISHYPPSLAEDVKSGRDVGIDMAGTGMSAPELAANPLFGGKAADARWVVKDLNVDPSVPTLDTLYPSPGPSDVEDARVDMTTLTVSIDYLTNPVAVLKSLLETTREGGTVHLAISNRCLPTKAVGRWLKIGEEERLEMVGDYLWFAGWRDVEFVTLSDGRLEGEKDGGDRPDESGVGKFMAMMGLGGTGRCDPLWIVRGRKITKGQSID